MFFEDIQDLKLLKDELLMKDINPWDKTILIYLAHLGYTNAQITYYSYQSIHKHNELTMMEQFYHCFLLMYSMININQCYKYFLFKTYQISPVLAEKLYTKFNKYFDFFENNADNIATYMGQKMKNYKDYDIDFEIKIKPKKKYADDSSDEENT